MQVANLCPSQLIWAPVSDRDKDGNTDEILRVGQLVANHNMVNGTAGDRWGTGGVFNHMAAAGVGNTTEEVAICGIVVGTNNKYRELSDTANYVGHEKINAVTTQAELAARNNGLMNGFWPQDDVPMVKIALLTPYTKVKVPLYNSTMGTAPTVNTVTVGSTTGLGFTADDMDCTPVANLQTSYCRSGANRGRMRQMTDASATVKTCAVAFNSDIAVGDTFVSVPLRPFGLSFPQLDGEAMFFDVSAAPATDHMFFHVHELHLEEAGNEYVIGTFDPTHFRATAA